MRKLVTAEYVHGKTGLDGPTLPDPKIRLREQHGVDFIIETLRRELPHSVTLCALGPLTNLGMAFVKAPDIASTLAARGWEGRVRTLTPESMRIFHRNGTLWSGILAHPNADCKTKLNGSVLS